MLAVVTGATKGIGRAIVERFASAGFDIALCARSEKDLEQFRVELEAKYPEARILACKADMSLRDDVKKFSESIKETFNAVDVLVNNAGVFLPGSLLEGDEDNFRKMMDTNLYSSYWMTRDLLGMISKGHIFNIASIASLMPYGAYSVSKFAMLGFSKVLREDLKEKNIRVTAVMPGATLTDSWSGVDLPASRFMPAEDIAEAVFSAWKLSDRTVVEEIVLRPQLGDI